VKQVKKGFELHLGKENPYNQYIQEVITKYDSRKQLKIPGIILNDVQKVLGHDADIVVAANAQDTGISVLGITKRKSFSPQKTIVVSATKSPKTIVVEDNSPLKRSSPGRSRSTPRTLTLGNPSTIIVSP
jgi:hypothetical protein